MAVDLTAGKAYFQTTGYPVAPISATMWVYFNGVTNNDDAYQNLLYFNAGIDAWLELNGATPRILLGDVADGPTIAAGTWYKVAIVMNGASSRLWVVLGTTASIGTGTATNVPNPTSMTRLGIGASGASDEEGLNGRLANFKMWSGGTALTQAQLDVELNSYTVTHTTGLLRAHKWITASAVPDSGSGANLSVAGTPTTVADPPQLSGVEGTAQATLGALSAEVTGVRGRPGSAEAQLGALSAEALGVVTHISARAELGALTAQALGDVAHTATASANLGDLSGLALGQRETYGQMQAELGALLAEIEGHVTVSGTATAELGRLSARMVADIDRPDVPLTGAAPHVSFWAVGEDGEQLTPLPHVLDFELSPIRNGVGSLQISYPVMGQGYDLLRAIVDDERQLPVEIWIGGTPISRMRGLLVEAAGDDTEESAVWTFAGHFNEFRMRDALVAPDSTPGNDWKTFFDNESPGVVVATLMLAAQDRGTLTDLTFDSFTDELDSNGTAWTQAVNLELAPHRSYDDVLADLVDMGVLEWEVTAALELRLYEPGTRGADRTLTSPPTILRVGGGLSQAQRKYSSRDAGTDLWVAGGDGLYDSTHDDTARARYGRQIERSDSQNYILDDGALQAYAQNKIGTITSGAMELTVGLEFGAGRPQPVSGFNLGDWIYVDAGSGTMDRDPFERYRVEQWTLTGSGDELSGTVTVNDVMAQRLARLEKLVRGVAGGAVVIGASVQQPDTKPPAAPEDVSASSLAYIDEQGTTFAAVTASWSAVTTNSDGTALFDLSGYYIRYRYTADGPGGYQDAGRISQAVSPTHTFSGVIAGSEIGVSVQAYDRTGLESDWSDEFILVAGSDATPPPVPSTPAVESYLGILTIEWDGLGSAGEGMPLDFDRVDIYASTASGFTPSSATYIDSLRGAGTMPSTIGTYGETWFAKLVAVDRSGNASDPSTEDGATLVQAGDGDLSGLSVGKLTAGIMSAFVTVSGIIRTATSGARVELDTTGFRCYSSANVPLFEFHIPTSVLSLVGKLTSGAGIGSGATVIVDPALPAIELYPNATSRRFRFRSWNATQPGGGASGPILDIQALNTSGNPRGPFIQMGAVTDTDGLTWVGHTGTSGATQGGILKLDQLGQAILGVDPSGGRISLSSNSGTFNGSDTAFIQGDDVFVDGDGLIELAATGGDVNIVAPSGRIRVGDPDFGAGIEIINGQTVNIWDANGNSRYKSFIIDHPTDPDRWLIHACAEGPTADLIYRGEAVIVNGRAIVELPPYFEAAARGDGRQVQLTPVDELCMVAASEIVNGRFIIKCSGDDGTVVRWTAFAIRADVEQFPVEPLKSEVHVGGEGPYRFLMTSDQAAAARRPVPRQGVARTSRLRRPEPQAER